MNDNGLTMDQEMVREEAIREERDTLLSKDEFISEWLTENATATVILKKYAKRDLKDGSINDVAFTAAFRVLISELQYNAQVDAEIEIDDHPEIWWFK